MLTPEYLAGLPDEMVALYGEAERDILADMARRIATYDYWIPAADWQYRKLREAGVCREEILRILSGLTGRTEAELEALIQKAATEALKSDAKVYADLGYDVTDWRMSQALIEILNDGFAATLGELRNLTRTTAVNAAQQFAAALDKAWMKVQTGTFDLNRAVRDAVKELSAAGVSAAKYASGRTDTLEVAVRRAVVTGINQCAGRLQLELAQQLGCRFMEITAHADARPSHALWQGQIVSLDGREGYLTLDDVGYGKIDGIFGVNCRHGWGPWDEGAERVWSEEKLRELNEPKYEYNGQKLTAYEASQTQRKIERNIRRWKRENAAMKAAGQDTTESAVKLRQWQEAQKDFLNQTGLKRQSAREQIYLNTGKKSAIMKSQGKGAQMIRNIDSPIEQRNTGRGKPSAILHYDVELNTRQQTILNQLPQYNSRTSVKKNDVSMVDLAAMTAKTGDEFALFTKGEERLIVRGNGYQVAVSPEEARSMGLDGFVWSGHTHPGADLNVLQPSEGDYAVLNQFNQENSSIYNSIGEYLVFERTEPYV